MPKNKITSKEKNEIFIKKAIEKWGNKYDYSEVDYIDSITAVTILFRNKRYRQTPVKHLLGKSIELSSNKMTNKEFIDKSKVVWLDRFDYSKCIYLGTHDKVDLFDIKNNVWIRQVAKSHLLGYEVNRKSVDEFIRKCSLLHDFKYNYKLVEETYKNSATIIKIICNSHGIFELKASSHFNGSSKCPHCVDESKKLVTKFLGERNINFVINKKFEECRYNGDEIPFDFYIPAFKLSIEVITNQDRNNAILIECSQLKKDYCEDNYINLISLSDTDLSDRILYKSLEVYLKILKK